MASRNPKNLKTLLAAYRVTSANPTDDLKDAIDALGYDSGKMISAVLKAVLADMRAEDEAAKKPAEDTK